MSAKIRLRGADVPILSHGFEIERFEDVHEGFRWRIFRHGKLESVATSRKSALEHVARTIYAEL